MTVKDLIAFLQTHDPELPVAYQVFSEQELLDPKDICVVELCFPRPDGWVEDKRPDKPSTQYLLFPGN